MNLRALGLALVGGLLVYAAHPPLDLGFLGFVAIAPLVALGRELSLSRDRPLWPAFGYGLIGGLATFGPMVYWLIPFGYVAFGLLSLIQAAYTGLFVAGVAAYGERRLRPVVTVALWVGLEALRGQWPLGGFGWGVLGYSQHDGGLALEVARTLGVYGVSAVLAIVAVTVEELARTVASEWSLVRASDNIGEAVFARGRVPLLTILATLVVAVLLGGEPPAPTGGRVEIGIAQAGDTRATSAAGVTRIDSERIERVARLALEATLPFAEDPPDLVVWPENSLDSDVRTERGEVIAELLETALVAVDPTPILAGEYRIGEEPRTLFNQMTVFRPAEEGLQIGPSYVKRQPVPFGEYVPAREWLDWFPPLEQLPNDTLPGDGPQVLEVAGAHVGGVICFENTFPDLARDQVRAGADVLVVGTNNSSYGFSPMSRQHIAFSQLRAVETGRWVVHAGISGISGFVSPQGEVSQETALFRQASPRMEIPLVDGLTPAVRVGPLVPALAGLVALAAMGFVAGQAMQRRFARTAEDGAAND